MPAVIHVHSLAGGFGREFSSIRYWPCFSARTTRFASSRTGDGRPSSAPTAAGRRDSQASCSSGASPFHQAALSFGLPFSGGCGNDAR